MSQIPIDDEMQKSYLDYAMSVIVSRALPDVRDGLKPVHRRILYAMHEAGYEWNKQHRKSARVVGDVIGKYHPHGDQAVYDALVRLAQDFSMRVPLLDGQGNFGSMDGDRAAAMRYTEVRMAKISKFLLEDIEKDTVEYRPNYDESENEPIVLPAKYPNLLVNGAGGIAVGMATNILPHNLGEVIDACVAYLDDQEISFEKINEIIKGPDFPTGGKIVGTKGIKDSQKSGRGSIIVQAKSTFEEFKSDREAIIFTELPYQVNKSSLIEKIAELVRDKRIEGISDLRDESDRQGVRVVVELKKGVIAQVILNKLYKFTPLQSSYGVNALALNDQKPELMNIKDFLRHFINHREEIISLRTRYDLNKARDRAHVLTGLAIAISNVDQVIEIIKNSKDPSSAKIELLKTKWKSSDVKDILELIDDPRQIKNDKDIYLTEDQAKSILELRLQRLTALGKGELEEELKVLSVNINEYLSILRDKNKLQSVIKDELDNIKQEFSSSRKTEIADHEVSDIDQEDLVQRSDMVISITNSGYIKRVPLEMYRAQKRGGKGRSGMKTNDEDFVTQVFTSSTHDNMLFFSSSGIVYKLKTWKIPESSPTAKGKAIINLLNLKQDDQLSSILVMPENKASKDDNFLIFATADGSIRKNNIDDFKNIQANGKIAMKLSDSNKIVGVKICTENDDVLLSTKEGKCIRTPVSKLRTTKSRSSIGVRGIKLAENDSIISLSILSHLDVTSSEAKAYLKMNKATKEDSDDNEEDSREEIEDIKLSEDRFQEMKACEQFVLTVTENGFGKRTSSYQFRVTNRGGSGIMCITTSSRNGNVLASFPVGHDDDIMLITKSGQLIRCPVIDIRVAGRNTQGVSIFKTSDSEKVVSASRVEIEN
ncbi:MAG: DNA gyrase subunit A [Pelagibacteraceae bacterium TMED258]|nr:MAG: DNA gyrase subunit A [Pelagibacteraceae bacterium TMED258]